MRTVCEIGKRVEWLSLCCTAIFPTSPCYNSKDDTPFLPEKSPLPFKRLFNSSPNLPALCQLQTWSDCTINWFSLFHCFWWVAMVCPCWLDMGRKRKRQVTAGPSLFRQNKLFINLQTWNETAPLAGFFHNITFCLRFPNSLVPAPLSVVLLLTSIHWHPFLCHITYKQLGFAYKMLLRPVVVCPVGHFTAITKRLTPKCRWPTVPISVPCWLDLHLHFSSCWWEELLLHSPSAYVPSKLP